MPLQLLPSTLFLFRTLLDFIIIIIGDIIITIIAVIITVIIIIIIIITIVVVVSVIITIIIIMDVNFLLKRLLWCPWLIFSPYNYLTKHH